MGTSVTLRDRNREDAEWSHPCWLAGLSCKPTVTDYNAVDENDEVHRVMMEVEPLLEASGKRNWRSIMLTHDEFPCHCLLQTWW